MTTQKNASNSKTNAKPTHTLRKKIGYGKQTDFETIGAAWAREDGGFYIKLHGTQIIDSGFYAFPIQDQAAKESCQ
mgnify:FL=1|tara:strand:- start:3346 stop:3573 length:228 start_codon:yes stop_codon:yes gene_type:complete